MISETASTFRAGQFLTFKVKDQTFGLDILHVKEIMAYSNVTPVPLVPEFIKGILNLRGNVVPIIDISRRFDWKKAELTRLSCIVVTEIHYDDRILEIGLIVDAVNEVVKLAAENMEDSPDFGANIRADFISNVGKVSGKFVLLLNIAKLLDVVEIQQLRQMSYGAPIA
jgi:purine-binding chemotaxis protein CheW